MKDRKKEEILKSAVMVFGSKGFHRTRVSDIAETAGVAKGTVYEYFANKEALFVEASSYAFDKLMEETTSKMGRYRNPVEGLEKLLRSHARAIKNYPPQYIKVYTEIWQYALWSDSEQVLDCLLYTSPSPRD